LGQIDEITLDIGGTVIERLDTLLPDTGSDDGNALEDDDESAAMPLVIAVDMSEEQPQLPQLPLEVAPS
jgi:exoribonuclease-2